MSMLDLRRMMLLCDLADLGTVTAVAERRNITSSAVSQQLRVLEDEADAILFRRVGRTLGLTRSGRVLADHARAVLGAVDTAMSALAETRDQTTGQVVVASYNLGIPSFAAPLLRQLSANGAPLEVALRQAEPAESVRLLRQGEVDVAITYQCDFEAQPVLAGMTREQLLVEPFVLLAPAELHPVVRARGFVALAGHGWATGNVDSILDIALRRAADAVGFTPRITHRLVTAQLVCDVAGTGTVAGVVPRLSVPSHLEHLIVDGVDVAERTVSAVVRTERHRDPNLRLVLRTLRAIGATALVEDRTAELSVAS